MYIVLFSSDILHLFSQSDASSASQYPIFYSEILTTTIIRPRALIVRPKQLHLNARERKRNNPPNDNVSRKEDISSYNRINQDKIKDIIGQEHGETLEKFSHLR